MGKRRPTPTALAPPCKEIAKPRRNMTRLVLPPSPFTLVINLKRRADRLRKIRKVLRESGLRVWERVEAVDGRTLDWQGVAEHMSTGALSNAQWAELTGVPTICRRTGSFSPHLTLSAVGCALSHRKAWEQLVASKHDWALILEDDVAAVADDLEEKLERAIGALPSSWQARACAVRRLCLCRVSSVLAPCAACACAVRRHAHRAQSLTEDHRSPRVVIRCATWASTSRPACSSARVCACASLSSVLTSRRLASSAT